MNPIWPDQRERINPNWIDRKFLGWSRHKVWGLTRRHAIKEGRKVANYAYVNHIACSLSHHICDFCRIWSFEGWSAGGAMVLGKLPVPGRPTTCNLDNSMARAYCACSRCGWGLYGHFFSHLSSFPFSVSFCLGNGPKYCLKRPLSPTWTTNHLW